MQVKIGFLFFTVGFAIILGLLGTGLVLTVKKKRKLSAFPSEKSGLTTEETDKYFQKLNRFMEVQTPYLKPELTLQQLAEELQIPVDHLSQVISEKTGYNFYNYINWYRIEAVKRDLSNPLLKEIPIPELAFKVGFTSKTAFNKFFKKFTGLTPQQFRLEFCSEENLHRLH
ncbi:MAG: helix-turn-helix domain-containing protein [Firmicutes bacterium]|nr:helix-turn-helix domain-containing protein [Bacillota bacterium]